MDPTSTPPVEEAEKETPPHATTESECGSSTTPPPDSPSTQPADPKPETEPEPDDMPPETDSTNADSGDTRPATSEVSEASEPSRKILPEATPVTSGETGPPKDGGEGGGGGGWGGWGNWGGSLWSSVSSVAGSAQALGQKVTAVIASVEDSLGVPSPEEMAQETAETDPETRRLAEECKEHDVSPETPSLVTDEPHPQEDSSADSSASEAEGSPDPQQPAEQQDLNFGAVSGFLSGFAAAVQTTGQGLVTGGLGALESLGKKTMEVLSEGDPRLAKKRAMLGVGPSPTLSQLLKEAKASESTSEGRAGEGELDEGPPPLSYSRLFDKYHGVSHLEALELLSKECAGKVHSMCAGFAGDELKSLQGKFSRLAEAFAIDEDQDNLEDDSSQLEEVKELFSEVTLPLKVDKLLKVSTGWREKVVSAAGKGGDGGEEGAAEDKKATSELLYENGLRSLAEMTSTAIELFRKMAEVSLLPDLPKSDALQQAQKFNRLTLLVSNELDALASVHSEAITELDLEGTNATVTSLYLESSNSGSYVQDAFQLLLPVLKSSLVQQHQLQQPEPNVLNRN